MTLAEIQRRIAAQRARLGAFGVAELQVFGSAVRGELTPASDVDFLVTFSGPVTLERFMGLRFFLEDLLERRVDLVTPRALSPRLRAAIAGDLRRVA